MPPPRHLIHASTSLAQTTSLWYPLIRDLGWNRALADGGMHYHAALDGATWLLVTPSDDNGISSQSTPEQPPAIQESNAEDDSTPSRLLSRSSSPSPPPQGCILLLPYPNATAWIGFFLVSPTHQGLGLGAALWDAAACAWAREGSQMIGLDGVEEQVPTYERRGFVGVGRIPVMVFTAESEAAESKAEYEVPKGVWGDLKDARREDLAALDREVTGLDRSRYWMSSDLLDRDDVFGFTHHSPSPSSSRTLTSLILIRACPSGHRIGPLFATSAPIASHLLRLAMQHPSIASSSGSLVAEIFGANKEARSVFEEKGWTGAGVEYHRMWYKGRVPEAQREGGRGTREMFAVFDAACG